MSTPSRSIVTVLLLALVAAGCAVDVTPEGGPSSEDGGGIAIDAAPIDATVIDARPVVPWEPDGGDEPEPLPEPEPEPLPAPDPLPDPDRDPVRRCEPSRVAGGERGVLNDDPRFVQVLVNNIENLEEADELCRGDWTDLVHFMREMRPQPDLFLVQQISDRAQLDRLLREMNGALRGRYEGIIAEADPRPFNSPCMAAKDRQTNAIIYRTERFAPMGERRTWQPLAKIDGSCQRSRLSRTMYVMNRFRDRVARRDTTVVSLHWSTNGGGGEDPACAEHNAEDLDRVAHLRDFQADLLIVGGDANEPDRGESGGFREWYRLFNGDRRGELRYRDPIFARCEGAPDLDQCLDGQWTIGGERRIDFLFAQSAGRCLPTTARAHTVSFEEAGAAARRATGSDSPLDYSDHRAVRAEVYY